MICSRLATGQLIAHPLNTASLVNEVAWLLSRTPLPTGLGGMTAEHRHPRVKEGIHLNTTVGKVLLEDLAFEYGVTDWVRLETGGCSSSNNSNNSNNSNSNSSNNNSSNSNSNYLYY